MKNIFGSAIVSALLGAAFLWAAWAEYRQGGKSQYRATGLLAVIALGLGMVLAVAGLLGLGHASAG